MSQEGTSKVSVRWCSALFLFLLLLFCLFWWSTEVMRPSRRFLQRRNRISASDFLPAFSNTLMSKQEKEIYLDTFWLFDEVWRKRMNRVYLLYSGSLLGAVRHKGFIPWDDDIDLLIHEDDLHLLESLFETGALSTRRQRLQRKVFFRHLRPGMRRTWLGWNWPFLDLFGFHFRNNGSELVVPGTSFRINASLVFPPRQLLFEGHWVSGPRCPLAALHRMYDSNILRTCCPNCYDHKNEGKTQCSECVPCAKVRRFFAGADWTPFQNDTETCEH